MHPDLLPHLATNQKIRVTTDTCEESFSGYLLALSDDLALLHTFIDFDPDGYTILRTEDIEEVRRSDTEAFWDTMLAAENRLSGLIRPPEIDTRSMRDAVVSIATVYPQMLIHSITTDAEGEWETFNLGVLVEARDDHIEFHTYDALGEWEDTPRTIRFSDIYRIQFDTRYANTFWRHIQPRPNI